jgi:hypothetical protein
MPQAHFLLDTLPVVLYVKRFRASLTARFGLLDIPLCRSLLKWLDPELEARVEWLPFGQVCLEAPSDSKESSTMPGEFSNFVVPQHVESPALVAV